MLGDVLQAQIEHVEDRVIRGERPALFSRVPSRIIQGFNGIRGVQDFVNGGGIVKEDRELRPVSPPPRADRRIVRIPRQGKALQGRFGFRDRRRAINGSQILGHGTPLPPHHIPQGLSACMHHAERHLGARKDRLYRVGQTHQSIDTGHEAIGDPAVLEIRQDRSPEFGSCGLTDPEASEFLFPRSGDAPRHRDRFGFDGSVMPRFHKETIELENRIDRFQGTTLPEAHIL